MSSKEFLLVLNKDEDTLSIVDLEQQEVTKTVPTDHNPHEIVSTKDKTYITCSLGNAVNIVDNNSFEIVDKITHPEFDFPHGVDLIKDKLYIASTFSSKVFIINTKTDEIERILPTFQDKSHMISPSPDGTRIYIPNIGSNNMTVLDTNKQEIINHFPVGKGPEGVAVHPNGKHLYVVNQSDNTLYVIDTDTYEAVHKRRTGTLPIRMVFSPDGKYAFIPNRYSADVSVIKTEHKMKDKLVPWEIKRIPVGIWPGGTVFNSDGTKAYVANNKTNDISVIDVSTLKETGRIEVGIHPDGIEYLNF